MLSAVITAALLIMMLLIIIYFVVSTRREYKRRKQAIAQATQPDPFDRYVTAILHIEDGQIVSIEKPKPPSSFGLPSHWYGSRRTLVSLGFIVMILLTLSVQDTLSGGNALRSLTQNLGLNILSNQIDSNSPPQHTSTTPSQRLLRVDSTNPQEFSSYQWPAWSYSSCSGMAMEMVMNAYGRHLTAGDVLVEEQRLGVWDVNQGLLRDEGITMTATYFGFNTDLSRTRSLDDVVLIASRGQPVIVSVRDSVNFPNGHIFVVTGGDAQKVLIADSSPHNFKEMTRAVFTAMWQGMSAVLIPKN